MNVIAVAKKRETTREKPVERERRRGGQVKTRETDEKKWKKGLPVVAPYYML